MSWLLDTCVISEFAKPTPDEGVIRWLSTQQNDDLFISVLTFGELEKGICTLPQSARRTRLEEWMQRDLKTQFEERILPVDLEVAERWGSLVGHAISTGRPLPVMDSLIAATALRNDMVVVTRNVDDLERCGVRVFNPWGFSTPTKGSKD